MTAIDSPLPLGELVRARSWDDYVGQTKLKTHLDLKIRAAVADGRNFDHTLLIAPPGAGKTTVARLIADRLGDKFLSLLMPMKMAAFVKAVENFDGGVILLDELHAAPKVFQEVLQPMLEDGYLPLDNNERLATGHITFIGATTTASAEKIIEPLRDRFKYHPVWGAYTDEDMAGIVTGMASRAHLELDPGTCKSLARAAGGTPRLASDLVAAARDLVAVDETVTVERVLELSGYDADGLTDVHLQYLTTLRDIGGRAGQATMGNMLRMSATTIQNLERLLVTRGYVERDPKGRRLTEAGKAKLGREILSPTARRIAANLNGAS